MRLAFDRRMPATVSILVPAHNAAATIDEVLQRIDRTDLGYPGLRRELIVVDDGSTDGTADRLREAATLGSIRACFHPEPLGHGACLATGLAIATGQIIVIADATLSYDPADLARLLAPILAGDADVVYGSRYVAPVHEVPRLSDRVADRILTAVSNGLTNTALTDMTTRSLAFRAEVVRGAILRAEGSGITSELTALFTARQCRIFEVPVAYRSRQRMTSGARWFENFSHLTMMARCRLRSWHLQPVSPARPFQAPATATTRQARLTRLVRPMDLTPPLPAHARPTLRPN